MRSANSVATPLAPAQVGFLYLRYTCNPRSIWEWFSPYLDDDEVGGERGAVGSGGGARGAFHCKRSPSQAGVSCHNFMALRLL